jgi:hypothetical protein
MPVYSFYRLSDLEAPPVKLLFFADDAAARYALGPIFESGADVWQGERFVGHFLGPAVSAPPPDDTLIAAVHPMSAL